MDETYRPVTLTIILGVEATKDLSTQLTVALSNLLNDQSFSTVSLDQKIISLKHALMVREEKSNAKEGKRDE